MAEFLFYFPPYIFEYILVNYMVTLIKNILILQKYYNKLLKILSLYGNIMVQNYLLYIEREDFL